MALMTTNAVGQDVVNSLIHAIWNQATEESSAELNYKDWGFNDYELDIEDEQLQGLSGPGVGVLTAEGQQYGSNERTRDYPVSFTLRKYTSELSVSEELQHWLNKASPKKKVMQLRTMVENALQAVQYNIDFDVAQMYFLGFGTTFFNRLVATTVEKVKSFLIDLEAQKWVTGSKHRHWASAA